FKAKGMGGAYIYCLAPGPYGGGPIPNGPAYLTPEWRKLYKHALREADRLGLEMGINFSSGWLMGGPWITPEKSGRWFLQSELKLTGPQRFSGILPLPDPKDGYDSPPQLQVANYIGLPLDKVDYRDTAVVAFREPERARLPAGDARRKDLPAKSNRLDADVFTHPRTVMDQTLTPWSALPDDQPIAPGDVVDLTARVGPGGKLDWDVPEGTWTVIRTGHRMTGSPVSAPVEGGAGLEVDFFSSTAVDQQWEHLGKILLADAGALVGKTLKYFGTDSFEDGYPNWTDKMLTEFKRYRGYDPKFYLPVLTGRLVGNAEVSERFLHDYRKTVADCMADNHYGHFAKLTHAQGMKILCEAAGPSWSQTMCMDGLKNLGRCDMPMGEFWRDLLLINNQNQVGKQTASAAHIYGRKTASAESFTSFQPHWDNGPALLKPIADRAFCEGINRLVFHTMTSQRPQDGKPGYEFGAGTHFNPNVTWWNQAAGPWLSYINRCQAILQSGLFVADVLYYNGDGAPNLVEPKHVDPSLGKGYDYDVCNAEVLLTRLSVKAGRLVLPDGMSYRLLVLPDSKRMPVEVVRKIRDLVKAGATVVGPRPESDPGLKDYPQCDAEVKKIAAEVWGGGAERSQKSEVSSQNTAETICRTYGKGRVFWGKSLREILLADGVQPDFDHPGDAFIDFIHRTAAGTEIYFLANRKDQAATVEAAFRVSGRQPELWDPMTGQQRTLPDYRKTEDGRTAVPLEFEPSGSMFVVFRTAGGKVGEVHGSTVHGSAVGKANFLNFKPEQEIVGPWTVQFDPQWFYPADGLSGDQAKGLLVFDKLEDWAKRPEPAIQYFSGTALYRKAFDFAELSGFSVQGSGGNRDGQPSSAPRNPDALNPEPRTLNPSSRLFLDLGTVKETANVRLNGKDLGVVWCPPWRVEITEAVKSGENALEIEVVNLWPNRLVGDGKLPAEQRRTKTNISGYYTGEHALLSSGLLGPVRVMRGE
ncbi:MAG: glycosyl hydrolase, partial [bacterium]